MSKEAASERAVLSAALHAIRAGDPEPYGHIVELFQRRLLSLVLTIVRDRAGAEDVVQESFVRAYTHLERFDERREFYPWIATIAARLAQNWRRDRARMRTREEVPAAEIDEHAQDVDVVGHIIADERALQLWQLVSELPQSERTAVHLYYRQDLSVSDVAQVLGVTVGTVKTLLFRARQQLRGAMARDPEPERPELEELKS